MKHVQLFEQFLGEAARLRGPRDWKKDIAYELNFDGDEYVDDMDGGYYYKVIYDGNTGFEITVCDHNDKELSSDYFDAEGYGSSEIQNEIYTLLDDMRNNL